MHLAVAATLVGLCRWNSRQTQQCFKPPINCTACGEPSLEQQRVHKAGALVAESVVI